jgi:outer membrane receptor for ferrienterochelin and colicins
VARCRIAVVALLVALAGAGSLAAQDAAVVVQVAGVADHAPVGAARLELLGAHRVLHTDARGGAVIGVPAWPDTLEVSAIGFRPRRVVLTEQPMAVLHVALETAPVVLPEMVTTAGRREQRVGEGTATVTVLERREVLATGASSLDQVVAEVPGIQLSSRQPAGATVQIRGLGDARVLVLVDGEPVSGSQLENRDLSRLSTFDVARIEITKGPTSLEHGSDALGGVINFVTRPATGPFAIELNALAGDQGRREAGAGLSRGGRFSFRASGNMREEARVAGLDERGTAMERVWDLRATNRYQLTDDWSLRADLNYFRTRQRWPVSATFNGFVDTWNAGGFIEAAQSRPWGGLRTRLVMQAFEYQFRQAQDDQPIAGTAEPQRETYYRGLVGYNRALDAHRLDFGVEGAIRDVEARDRIQGNIGSDRQLDLYGQDSWSLGRVLLQGGARWSHNSRWGSTVTPSTGIAYEVTPSLRLKATAARGFRGPSMKELGWTFANVQAGYIIQGNPDLRPEESWSLSTGATWAPARGLSIEGEVYRNSLTDLIDFATVGFTPGGAIIFTPRNVAKARTEGFEGTVRGKTGGWAAEAGYAYLHAVDLTNDLPLDRRARHSGRFQLTRDLGWLAGGAINVTLRYTGKAEAIGTDNGGGATVIGVQDPFLSVDTQASLAIWDGTTISVGADNITNRQPAGWPGVTERRAYAGIRTRLVP